MQRYDGEMDARGAMFSFPACTRDATQASRQADARTFHFPLVREMQHEPDDGLCLFHVFISRLYARCNIQYLAVSLVMLFSFPACTRDATIVLTGWQTKDSIFHFPLVREMQRRNRIRNFADLVFSFPACTRDATASTVAITSTDTFSFPACTRDATLLG